MNRTLVAAYFDHWRTKRDDLAWAWDKVTDKILADPREGWHLVRELIQAAPTEDALLYVAAGPLEDFLSKHGRPFIALITSAAEKDPRMKRALGGVWGKNRMDPLVWSEVQRLCGRGIQ